jgi:diaminohydroxyphosphoribosylaminopyrimidine deaminase/5-amino-6-(5-phosphoribosylamino)uracil reductase
LNRDEIYIKRCLELAAKGQGMTRQNPMVGAVVVYQDKIIGEGYHINFGGPHAEVNALNSVREKRLITRSSLYVNLEPCSHFGKTPPCTTLIRDLGIPRVVIGTMDPNPRVNMGGYNFLRDHGIEVNMGVCEEECRYLNRRFFTFHEKKRPYVILKWAQSVDGFMDILREPGHRTGTNWISNETSRILVHKWRSEEAAIMSGTNTVLTDDPELTVRHWPGDSPVRVIPDKNGRLSDNLKIFNGKSQTLVFISTYKADAGNIHYINGGKDSFTPYNFMQELYKLDIQSILLEGGPSLLNSFIEAGLWDEARIITGNVKFTDGIKAPALKSGPADILSLCGDVLELYFNNC